MGEQRAGLSVSRRARAFGLFFSRTSPSVFHRTPCRWYTSRDTTHSEATSRKPGALHLTTPSPLLFSALALMADIKAQGAAQVASLKREFELEKIKVDPAVS